MELAGDAATEVRVAQAAGAESLLRLVQERCPVCHRGAVTKRRGRAPAGLGGYVDTAEHACDLPVQYVPSNCRPAAAVQLERVQHPKRMVCQWPGVALELALDLRA